MDIVVTKTEARSALTRVISFIVAMVAIGLLKYLADMIPGARSTRLGSASARDWIELCIVIAMAVLAVQLSRPVRTLVHFYALRPLAGHAGFERVRKDAVSSVNALIFLVVISLVFGILSTGSAIGNITGFQTANRIIGLVGVVCGVGGLVLLAKSLIPLCGTVSKELACTLMPVDPGESNACPKCGERTDPGVTFCAKCGARQ